MKVKSGGNNDHRLRDDDLIILTFENGRASLTDIFEKLLLQRDSQVKQRINTKMGEMAQISEDPCALVNIPLIDKGNRRQCSNYRGISLIYNILCLRSSFRCSFLKIQIF